MGARRIVRSTWGCQCSPTRRGATSARCWRAGWRRPWRWASGPPGTPRAGTHRAGAGAASGCAATSRRSAGLMLIPLIAVLPGLSLMVGAGLVHRRTRERAIDELLGMTALKRRTEDDEDDEGHGVADR